MFSITITISMDKKGNINFESNEDTTKTREFKGTSVSKHVDDYCVLDLETTGVFVGSASIIEISAIRVRNNKVVDEISTLVNPDCHIPEEATAINHITDEMVKNAPFLEDVIDDFLAFVGDDTIVGYNNASFDMNLIYDRVLELRDKHFSNNYIDLLHASRRSIKGIDNYKLKTICEYYGIDTTGEHRALKDCYLTKDCYDKLFEEFGDYAFKRRGHSSSGKGYQYSSETLSLRELHALLESMLEDGKITLDEVDALRFWLEEHTDLSGIFPFDKAFNAINDILEDGVITQEELIDLKNIFSDLIDPVKTQSCHEKITSLHGKHVCLSGEFDYGTKSEVEQLILNAGGVIDKNVKKSTNYLVVGANGSDAWKTGKYGGKIQKAMEYNSKGIEIFIFEEQVFIPMTEHLIEQTNDDNCMITEKINSDNWKASIQSMLEDIIKLRKLPEQSLYLRENYGRDKKELSSYSVCIYEPEYPSSSNTQKDATRNSIVLNIKEANNNRLEVIVGAKSFSEIDKPEDAEIKQMKSDSANIHILFSKETNSLLSYIKKQTEYALENYKSIASSFGCCHLYLECSKEKQCIHENKLYSKACTYRKNLEAGKIFYGCDNTE